MKIFKNGIIWLCIVAWICLLSSCSKDNKNRVELQDIYGGEMYNSTYVYVNGETLTHSIPILSKKEIKNINCIDLNYKGGSFDLDYNVVKESKKIDEYTLYYINLNFSNIKFDADIIDIKSMQLNVKKDVYDVNFDKCQIKDLKLDLSGDKVDINGTPLEIPFDMNSFPTKVSSEENVEITNIFFTNEEFKVSEYISPIGEVTKEFVKTKLNPEPQCFDMKLDIDVSGENKYKQYGTSFIIEYEFQGNRYYEIPAVTTSIYNPFVDNIEDYFEHIKNK